MNTDYQDFKYFNYSGCRVHSPSRRIYEPEAVQGSRLTSMQYGVARAAQALAPRVNLSY